MFEAVMVAGVYLGYRCIMNGLERMADVQDVEHKYARKTYADLSPKSEKEMQSLRRRAADAP